MHAGEFAAAAALLDEEREAVADATGSRLAPYGALRSPPGGAAKPRRSQLIEASMRDAMARGEGTGVGAATWASALLYNGLGRYDGRARRGRGRPARSPTSWRSPRGRCPS